MPQRYNEILENTNVSPGIEFPSKYLFKYTRRNPEWSYEKLESLRSCLIHNKSSQKNPVIFISKTPKWITTLQKPTCIDTGSGEIFYVDYETDDFRQANHRKILTVEKFCNKYEPLYRERRVSVLFHTFTRINHSKKDMVTMIECAKKRYKALKRPIRGYLWCIEVGKENNMIHYHLVVAITRVTWTKIPDLLKFEDLWGQRTGVEFVKRSVKRYLTKYLYKSDARILERKTTMSMTGIDNKFKYRSKRAYAISRTLK
jgi:hypothetical protein